MSTDPTPRKATGDEAPIPFSASTLSGPAPIAKAGGALGIASMLIGLAIFLAGCAGFDAAFKLALVPLLLSAVGLVVALYGAFFQKTRKIEDSQTLAALWVNLAGMVGSSLLIAVWQGWSFFSQ
jgi:hypothetical protein